MRASAIYAGIKARLLHVLDKPDDFVRYVITPEDQTLYRNEDGIWISLSGPRPEPRSGAGRLAMKNSRIVTVGIVTTKSLLDVAGEAEVASLYHADAEDDVIDALIDGRPGMPANLLGVGYTCNHVGGTEARRYGSNKDSTTVQSTLLFEVSYTGALLSRRVA